MRYADALAAFRRYLEARGLTAEDLDSQAAVTAMLGFYKDERATDVDLDLDGDMLLFQWGTYDWRQGAGPAFEYNITRQFVDEDVDDDESEGFWQLRLTVYFRPDEQNARLRSGDRWLERPAGLGEFADWIAGLPVTAYCASRRPSRASLDWDEV